MRIVTAAAILLMTATSAPASDAKGDFSVRGIGGQTCKAVLERMQGANAVAAEVNVWMSGYMTAVNRLTPNTYDASPVIDPAAHAGMVLGVCRANQEALLESAAAAVMASLATAKLQRNSPLVQLKGANQLVIVRSEAIDKIHAALAAQKLMPAKKPGASFDAATEKALRAFQRRETLPETGLPDSSAVIRMLVERPARQAASAQQGQRKPVPR